MRQPIGVFDSGVGGLSILRALLAELPHEDFVYVADNAHAPYGERDPGFVVDRSRHMARYLVEQQSSPVKALVIACNTATAAAIHLLRSDYPDLPIVGVEPALKPALAMSQTRRIGVMATRATLNSPKFLALHQSLSNQADFVCQPCSGLADAIERHDTAKIVALCADYTGAMGKFGQQAAEIDTLVLGCTHYPFALDHLTPLLGPAVQLVSNGIPVARQTRRVLPHLACPPTPGTVTLRSTGDHRGLLHAARRWLPAVCLDQDLRTTAPAV